MTENEDLAKLVDGAYKNILERFNPCARQLISAGKAYLKALHGAVAASKAYIDAIAKLARHAHQGTWGGCTDIGTALMQLVDVQREIQAQQMNILKAFYIDLLAPLETNLEKDGKIVASEQKRFQQQHKTKQEAYLKATANMKKQKKKIRSSKSNLEKEIRHLHTLEEEKSKLDLFCEQNLKQAIIQERRRFGFVLERQCSLAKHYLAYHTKGQALLQYRVEEWQNIIRDRETLPESMKNRFPSSSNGFCALGSEYACSNILDDSNGFGPLAPMRKTRSIDATCADETELKDFQEVPYARPLSRAKSDFNLASSSASLVSSEYVVSVRPKSLAESNGNQSSRQHVRALYSYLSSGEHQLCFHEGDIIALIGERNKGWHYGENLRNHRCGWFPIAYTEPVEHSGRDDLDTAASSPVCPERRHSSDLSTPTPSSDSSSAGSRSAVPSKPPRPMSAIYASSPTTMPVFPPQRPLSTFVEGRIPETTKLRPVLPPSDERQEAPSLPSSFGPAPVPLKSPAHVALIHPEPSPPLRPPRRSLTSPVPLPLPPPRLPPSFSLHSSNDSGFGNDSGSAHQSNRDRDDDEKPKDNIFATVKLRKVVTNDRSAPIIS